MDKTPKSKFFGFRKCGPSLERSSPSNSRSISKTEVIDLETLPISPNAMPTSPAVTRINTANSSSAGQSSPQFIVGWNDGAESTDLDMCSPIRTAPVLRNIRRCPDNLAFKPPKNKSKVNRDDILQCIDWSKNLFETTSKENEVLPDEEKVLPVEEKTVLLEELPTVLLDEDNKVINDAKKVTEPESQTKDISIDILDDSVDEIMIMCSQAVEQSLPLLRLPSKSPISSIPEKHKITPDPNDNRRKKLKIDNTLNAKSKSIEKNWRTDNSLISHNNNNNNNNNENCHYTNFKMPSSNSKQEIKSGNPAAPSSVSSKVPSSSDKIVSSNSVSSHASICAPKLNEIRTKEQIEKRRLEAKKRLLFNKKYKSV
ncbi:hypothetical protein V9T40_003998 [Parthenolecanium corni]|uniref:Uncharacterized protein n=1 Tax=Parthenolecanium corni TaxID=536013 RepID=A0AAN9TGP9_9HEMI